MYDTSERYKVFIEKDVQRWESKLVIDGNEYKNFMKLDGKLGICADSHISFGGVVSSYIEVQIPEMTSSVQFIGRQVTYYSGLHLEDYDAGEEPDIEWIKIGVFNVVDPQLNDDVVSFTAYDNMYKAQQGFFTSLSGNQAVATVLEEQCAKIGIIYAGGDSGEIINVDKLQGLQMRDAFMYIASFCGKNAIMNRDGNLELRWFTNVDITVTPNICSTQFSVGQSDTVIKQIACAVDNESESLHAGTETGSMISFSNPCMTQTQLDAIFNKVNGFTYRSCSVNIIMGRPDLDVGDIITVQDLDGSLYTVPIMLIDFIDDSGQQQTITANAQTEQQEQYTFQGNLTTQVQTNYTDYLATKRLLADTIIAYNGKFGTIETDFATINQKLTGFEGEFTLLEADLATFKSTTTNDLTAIHAQIGNLDVGTINAAFAKLNVIEGDVADINTIINGHFTSDDIHALIINSENTTFANSVIKDAMIDSLSFDKITGIDVNTTKLTVHSDDGNSTWKDNTILIKDGVRNRVQIGKDALGDYNIYIWDAQGNLMFDPLGLTEDGVNRQIIDNDSVKDNAAIHGSKLDIDSVITSINGSTTTIKSSKIYYDEEAQTLDVLLNSMSSTVETANNNAASALNKVNEVETSLEEVTTQVETNTTNISVANGSISSLITRVTNTESNITTLQGDVTTAKGNITTLTSNYNSVKADVSSMQTTIGEHTTSITSLQNKDSDLEKSIQTVTDKATSVEQSLEGFKTTVNNTYATKTQLNTVDGKFANYSTTTAMNSAINQKANEITQTVSSTYTTKAEFDSLEIGGRNFARETSPEWSDWWTPEADTDNSTNYFCYAYLPEKAVGDSYTVSFDIEWTKFTAGTGGTFELYTQGPVDDDWIITNFLMSGLASIGSEVTADAGTKHISKEVKISTEEQANASKFGIGLRCNYSDGTGQIRIKNIKVEKGNKATDWTPAPEDIQSQIANVEEDVKEGLEEAYKLSEISQTLTDIIAKVEEVEIKATDNETAINEQENKFVLTSNYTEFVQTTSDFITDVEGNYVKQESIDQWMKFEDGILSLGTSSNNFSAQISNTDFGLWQGDNKVAWLSNNELHVSSSVIEKEFSLGNFTFVIEADGGLGLTVK